MYVCVSLVCVCVCVCVHRVEAYADVAGIRCLVVWDAMASRDAQVRADVDTTHTSAQVLESF